MNRQTMAGRCKLIAEDMERDARQLDGKPFDGNTVATQFGYNCAAIQALALTLRELLLEESSGEDNK